jgi:2'-5' RNA ligase
MEQVRAFIAIELPTGLKQKLGQLEMQLKAGRQPCVKWVRPDSIHLTLKFLGNIAVDTTAAITEAIAASAQGMTPFHLWVKELGVFPNLKRVQVAWVGISGDVDKLAQLQKRLESNLTPLGFASESRPFTPHLTLARLSERAAADERQAFGQLIASTTFNAGDIEVKDISLMKSQLTRAGAIYTRISQVRLKSLPARDPCQGPNT